jgi:hypothetical protein
LFVRGKMGFRKKEPEYTLRFLGIPLGRQVRSDPVEADEERT